MVQKRLISIATDIANTYGVKSEIDYQQYYPVLVNHDRQTELTTKAATEIVGADEVNVNARPTNGCEDFSYMLNARPSAYIWLGNGNDLQLYNPECDFNEDATSY